MVSNFNDLLKYQNKIQAMLKKEQKEDQTIEVLSIINELAPYPGQSVQKEKVFLESAMHGVDEAEAQKIIDKLKIDRIIFEPQIGYIQKR